MTIHLNLRAMAKIYSLMSWNIEHFKKNQDNQTQQRVDRISAQIRNEDPDVFAIYEVEGKDVFNSMQG
jgi:endonuclease/exonuclease/phosphatase family metal-dependent hydrolase